MIFVLLVEGFQPRVLGSEATAVTSMQRTPCRRGMDRPFRRGVHDKNLRSEGKYTIINREGAENHVRLCPSTLRNRTLRLEWRPAKLHELPRMLMGSGSRYLEVVERAGLGRHGSQKDGGAKVEGCTTQCPEQHYKYKSEELRADNTGLIAC